MQCPACAAEAPEDDLFCENCGERLSADGAAPHAFSASCACGAAAEETDEDGFCLRCGLRARRPSLTAESDHIEQAISPLFAAVTDKGQHHDRNEDRFSIFASDGAFALVVCDGVSTTRQSELASSAVTEGALAFLTHALEGRDVHSPFDAEALLREAVVQGAANLAAHAAPDDRRNPPSTTVVAALVLEGEATIGWLGDSRAYWVDAEGAKLLTHDHSWMNEIVAAGGLTAEQAARAPQAHAITRWIGADSTDKPETEIVRHRIAAPGTLLLCTDGLWNYASTDAVMGNLVSESSVSDQDALAVARRLVEFANQQGGQDNITAAVLRFAGPS
jgi:serine/threonine protein phosphatase PrpC